MADLTNRVHVSPGIYNSETVDMKAAANSLGVTKLALVGETLKGPAFQKYWIASPKEYASVFGGTSTKKFKGSGYPQYELPYIASEFLTRGNQLCVVRTLGFSGYNAGPAWVITGHKQAQGESGDKYVIAVLRARGTYKYRAEYEKQDEDGCPCQSAYDSMTYNVGEIGDVTSCAEPRRYNMSAVKLTPYSSINSTGTMCTNSTLSGSEGDFGASYGNLGRFTIQCLVGTAADGTEPGTSETSGSTVSIPVSLNKSDKDYILKVLGTRNDDGDQPLFVENLYDVAWEDLVVNNGFDGVMSGLSTYNVAYTADYCGLEPINGILTKYEAELTKKDVGKRYLYTTNLTNASPSNIEYYVFDYKTNRPKQYTSAKNAVVKEADAPNSTIVIEDNEYFQITDGTNGGLWVNLDGVSHTIKELYGAITSGAYKVEKIESNLGVYITDTCTEGHIYTVASFTDGTGKKHYVYKAFDKEDLKEITSKDELLNAEDKLRCEAETSATYRRGMIVYNYEDGLYYKNDGEPVTIGNPFQIRFVTTSTVSESFDVANAGNLYVEGIKEASLKKVSTGEEISRNSDDTWTIAANTSYSLTISEAVMDDKLNAVMYENEGGETVINNAVIPVECDLNDYKSAYRYSSTPWVVSNAKGDANHIELNKMFRFHTISDGASSVSEVKVSIENIRPDSGEFDVVVRAYGDTDASPVVLERYMKCTMAPGKRFIGYMIGTLDGQYESKSKYITVEVADTTSAINSIPAGFLGYPVPQYGGATIVDGKKDKVSIAPIKYNTAYKEDVPKRRQYFGISDRVGYDVDYFTFKGNMSTLEDPDFMTHGFHLDCRVNEESYSGDAPAITVDGEAGYVFDSVSVNARTSALQGTPIIATEDEMDGCIFEDIKLRKFTLAFAGGFDGWDEYRDQRTNGDEYSYSNYKGYVNKTNGVGYAFNTMNGSAYGIDGSTITSDYYSTLAGVSLLKNPEEVDINLLATPGIDVKNNAGLVNEVFSILADRADTFYIVTTPDQDADDEEMQDVDSVVADFESQELYSDYAATYYPWVKIEDNGEYIWLPVTKDIVRNMAESDNTNSTMNLAPAGLTRGRVDAIRARKNLKLAECDALYDANINPVRTYAQEGVVVMGQKTLRETDDLANRIDVRRCVLRMRKLIAIGTLGLIFEPNDNSTVKSFKSIVNGIMEGFIKNRAISQYRLEVDESEEARDRLEIPATIYIKPVRALEYISINFVVTNNGAYFED